MLKAIKIRLYPNDLQSQQFHELLGCYRFVYNSVLDRKISKYSIDKKSENLSTLGKYFHGELLKNLKSMVKFLFFIPLFILDLLLVLVWAILSLLFWKDFLGDEDTGTTFLLSNHFLNKF